MAEVRDGGERRERPGMGLRGRGAARQLATQFRPVDILVGHPETGRSSNSQQSRFSISDTPFREKRNREQVLGKRSNQRRREGNPASAVLLDQPLRDA